MITSTEILLGIAALGGIILAFQHLRDQRPPLALALIHGLFAAAGLVTLIISVLQGAKGGLILASLTLFVVAALGGFLAFSFRLRNKTLPRALIFVHGIVAIIAYVLLIMGAM